MNIKECAVCGKTKPIEQFSIDRARPDGRCQRCKACRKLAYENDKDAVAAASMRWYAANKERHNIKATAYYYANRERQAERMAQWYLENKELVATNVDAYRSAHPGFGAAQRAKRRAQELKATPAWADLDAIKAIYSEAARLTSETGIKHHVDHKIPLQGRNICGLHIASNLQILTAPVNISKSNKFEPIIEFFSLSEESRDAA